MEANLGFKNRFLGAQVGLHFGGGLGGQEAPKLASILEGSWRPMSGSQAIFLRPNMAPCWPHVSPQHEPMLDFQHEPMLEANMDLCWRPTWTHFGSQHGLILEADMGLFSVSKDWKINTFRTSILVLPGLSEASKTPPRRLQDDPRRLQKRSGWPKTAQDASKPAPEPSGPRFWCLQAWILNVFGCNFDPFLDGFWNHL